MILQECEPLLNHVLSFCKCVYVFSHKVCIINQPTRRWERICWHFPWSLNYYNTALKCCSIQMSACTLSTTEHYQCRTFQKPLWHKDVSQGVLLGLMGHSSLIHWCSSTLCYNVMNKLLHLKRLVTMCLKLNQRKRFLLWFSFCWIPPKLNINSTSVIPKPNLTHVTPNPENNFLICQLLTMNGNHWNYQLLTFIHICHVQVSEYCVFIIDHFPAYKIKF